MELQNTRNAVVIGGSMAGLLAARVLSEFYRRVIIVERDDVSLDGINRRGVPQGRHAHALLSGGQQVLERLFPGISAELFKNGAIAADPLADGTWFFEGGALQRRATGQSGILSSRPFLESHVRARVRHTRGVEILLGVKVRGLRVPHGDTRVTGVLTDEGSISADLVVDATGRGSRASKWLETLGYARARKETVEIQLGYTTRIFRRANDTTHDNKFVVIAPTPEGKRGGVIAQQEGGRWICTLFGHFGHVAPDDLGGFREYARSLPSPALYEIIRDAEPVGESMSFKYPASTRRRYEELRELPSGFLVFGDAICSFNPIYGQGMSVAALQAEALAKVLRGGTQDLSRRFFKEAAKVIDNPWNIAVGGDLRMPETIGPRNLGVTIINWYIANVHKLAHDDAATALAFTRVAQLLDPPTALMKPSTISRVLAGVVKRGVRGGTKLDKEILRTIEPAVRTRNRLES